MYAYWRHVYAYAYVCMNVYSRLICVCFGFVCEFNGVNHMHVYACAWMYMSVCIFTSCLRTSKKHDRIYVLLVWILGIWNMGIRPHCPDSLKQCIDMHPGIHHDDVIKWKPFPRYWPFVQGIHRSPVNSPHNGQWRRALIFSLICVWLNGWVNNREAGDLRRHRAHYDVIVMFRQNLLTSGSSMGDKGHLKWD